VADWLTTAGWTHVAMEGVGHGLGSLGITSQSLRDFLNEAALGHGTPL
jgi:hypothetical protein